MGRQVSYCPVCLEESVFDGERGCTCPSEAELEEQASQVQCDMCHLFFRSDLIELGVCELCMDLVDEHLYGYSGADYGPDSDDYPMDRDW